MACGWINLAFLLQKSFLNLYVIMLIDIFMNYLKFVLLFGIFLTAFAMVFYMEFQNPVSWQLMLPSLEYNFDTGFL